MKTPIYLFLILMLVTSVQASDNINPNPPVSAVRLVFIHHSVGEGWLTEGGLRRALNENNYYVTDTNYGWGPESIGDRTDIGHWYDWFLGSHRDNYLEALYTNDHITDGVGPNNIDDPGSSNTVVMFKSCFPNGHVSGGNPDNPPLPKGEHNPIWGREVCEDYTVENIKGLYRDLLDYFETQQDKLFILITSPPSLEENVDAAAAGRHRAISSWLVQEWLSDYPYENVFAFDYYNVLTSNGGDPETHDLDAETGNHHRFRNGKIEHVIGLDNNFLAYGLWGDDHPTAAGHQKATGEFTPLLNIVYNRWRATIPREQFSISPKSLHFGSVEVGSTVEQRVTITNTGTEPIRLDTITLTGANADEFNVLDDCSGEILAPLKSCNINLIFRPNAAGTKTASLAHRGDFPFTVQLEGNGKLPPVTLAEGTVIFQHGVSPTPEYEGTADSVISALPDWNPDANLGAWEHLNTYWDQMEAHRIVIRFELAGIPSGANILSATLSLRHFEGADSPQEVTVYRLTKEWVEGTGWDPWTAVPTDGVSWIKAALGATWDKPGGDFDTTTDFGNGPNGMVGTHTVEPLTSTEGRWENWDITPLAQGWIDGAYPNYGMILRPSGGEWIEHLYRSRNYEANPSFRPILKVILGEEEPPISSVTNFAAVGGDGRVQLTWQNPAHPDWAGTRILRKIDNYPLDENDGTVVYDGTGTSHTDTDVVNDTTYYYTAFAYDSSGNFSPSLPSAQGRANPTRVISYEQPTDTQAFHRSGQTFITWQEIDSLSGERYRIYRHTASINAGNLSAARPLATINEGSSIYPTEREHSDGVQRNFIIEDLGPELSDITGLFVYTVHDSGNFYYAVTTIFDGSENISFFSAENSLQAGVSESEVDPQPVLVWQSDSGHGRVYTQFMDYHDWNPHYDGYAYNYSVSVPADYNPGQAYPLVLNIEGYGSRYERYNETPWDLQAIFIRGDDANQTWYYGYANADRSHVRNYTEERLLRSLYDVISDPYYNVDTDRIYAYGHSMGGSGALALGMRYPNVFAAIFASEPMSDYAISGNAGGTDWVSDVEPEWGTIAEGLPIVNRGHYAKHLQRYDGQNVWDWQNHQLNMDLRRGDEMAFIALYHGTEDDIIDTDTQGYPFYESLYEGHRAFIGQIFEAGHTWINFIPHPNFDFGALNLRKNYSFPAFSYASGSTPVPVSGIAEFNLNLEWSCPWNDFSGGLPDVGIVDTSQLYEIIVRSTDGDQTVDITPRRLQRFEVTPSETCSWRNIRRSDGTVMQSGVVTADDDGLITIRDFQVSTGSGNLLRISREISSEPPGDVTNLTATSGDKRIKLAWQNPDAEGWVGTRIVRNIDAIPSGPNEGDVVYDGNNSCYIDRGLSNRTTYYYAAFAYNEALDYSDNPATASTTPQAVVSVERREFPGTKDGIYVFVDQLPSSNAATDAQYEFAATHYVGTQKMLLSDVRHLREYNPDFIVLHYRLSMGLTDHFEIVIGDDWVDEYEHAESEGLQEDWFVHTQEGERILQTDWNWYVMDPSGEISGNRCAGWKEYWTNATINQMRITEYDGIFADSSDVGVLQSDHLNPPDLRFSGTNMLTQWTPHVNTFFQHVIEEYAETPERFYFITNAGAMITSWNRAEDGGTDYTIPDGVMIEGFGLLNTGVDVNTDDWRLEMDNALELIRQDKIILAQPALESVDQIDDRLFFIGSYLLIKGSHTYINIATGDVGSLMQYYPEYDLDLGSYVSDIPENIDLLYDEANEIYQREYENGMVMVNPSDIQRTVELDRTYRLATPTGGGEVNEDGTFNGGLTYADVTSITIPAWSARILLTKEMQACTKGDVNEDGKIRSNDATMALRIAVGLMQPTDYHICAADANDDGKVRANDAILILRQAVGLAAPSIQPIAAIKREITVMLNEAHGVAGESITVPIMIDKIHQLAGGEILIAYDPTVLRAVDVSSDSDILLQSNISESRMIQIAFASANRLNSKTVAKIRFEVLADEISPLTLLKVRLYQENALSVNSKKVDGKFSSWAIPPKHSALLQNFPNPFNPETWIPYQLKRASEVTIRIYNVAGELVRELKLGRKQAGLYVSSDRAAYWDGRDSLGEKVASGVYFYTLQFEEAITPMGNSGHANIGTVEFKPARKMVILK